MPCSSELRDVIKRGGTRYSSPHKSRSTSSSGAHSIVNLRVGRLSDCSPLNAQYQTFELQLRNEQHEIEVFPRDCSSSTCDKWRITESVRQSDLGFSPALDCLLQPDALTESIKDTRQPPSRSFDETLYEMPSLQPSLCTNRGSKLTADGVSEVRDTVSTPVARPTNQASTLGSLLCVCLTYHPEVALSGRPLELTHCTAIGLQLAATGGDLEWRTA